MPESLLLLQCITSAKPIDFTFNKATNSYDLSQFATDQELVEAIQKGSTDKYIYRVRDEDYVNLDLMFRKTQPEKVLQD